MAQKENGQTQAPQTSQGDPVAATAKVKTTADGDIQR